MRLILRVVSLDHQKSIKKLNFISQQNKSEELLFLIQKLIKNNSSEFIATLLEDSTRKNRIRILANWPLDHYHLKQGDELQILIIGTEEYRNCKQMRLNGQKEQIVTQFQAITQQKQDAIQDIDSQRQKQIDICTKVIDKKLQKVLKVIQKDDYDKFMEAMQFSEISGECEQAYMKQKLEKVIDQLGQSGWAAIHYAVFFRKVQILKQLIKKGVNVNKRTADQWLPIQLAINDYSATQLKKQEEVIDVLLQNPHIDLNIVTQKGTALHNALNIGNLNIVTKILSKKTVDPFLKDHLGRTFQQVTHSEACFKLLKNVKFIGQEYLKVYYTRESVKVNQIMPFVFRGAIFQIRKFPMSSKQRYLVINIRSGTVIIFNQRTDFPQNPKQVLPIISIKKVSEVQRQPKDKIDNIFSKLKINKINQLYILQIVYKKDKKIQFGCHFHETLVKWIEAFQRCCQIIRISQTNPQILNNDKIEQITIIDRKQISSNQIGHQPQKNHSPKKKYPNLMEIFSHNFQNQKTSQDTMFTKNVSKSGKSENTSDTNSSGDEDKRGNVKLTSKHLQAIRKSIILDNCQEAKPRFKDFKIENVLGEGSFGSVYLATHLASHKQFALKVMPKKKMIIQKQVRFAASEISILKQIDHPFVMNLHFTFQTANYIYLGLDFCQGKDLAYHLVKQGNFNEDQCRFYAAQILLALEHLHSKNILYRDMKPDNILLDGQGHIKITDFGLSKQCQKNREFAKSFCGSPAYLSPEMVAKKGASKATDFYGLGAVMFEMLVGQPPFYDQNINNLYSNIAQGKLKFPKGISSQAKSIISSLLERQPQKRLGTNGIQEIKKHLFFQSIDFQKLFCKQIKPPIRPCIQQLKMEDKQNSQQLQFLTQIIHKDHDYDQNKTRTNRFLNFSFMREHCFQEVNNQIGK